MLALCRLVGLLAHITHPCRQPIEDFRCEFSCAFRASAFAATPAGLRAVQAKHSRAIRTVLVARVIWVVLRELQHIVG